MDKFMEKLGNLLYDKLPRRVTSNESVRQDLTSLAPAGNIPQQLREFYSKKLALCALIVVIGAFLGLVLWTSDSGDAKLVDNTVYRNEYGDGENVYELTVTDGEEIHDITLSVSQRAYTDEETQELFEGITEIIDSIILGRNESLDKIEYDLNFASSVSGYPFSIEYDTDYNYIDADGNLVNRELEKPVIVEINMTFTYNRFEAFYTVYGKVYSKAIGPTLEELIYEQLNIEESKNREDSKLSLPDTIGDKTLEWNYKRSYKGIICLIVTPLFALFIYFGKDKDLHQKVEERQEQMRMDYPDIVSSLALLIGAGMTVPNAWKKVAYDYRKRRDDGLEPRFAYEEMLFTIYEMDSGITQGAAFERFGRRCRIPCYNKLATIVSQNIKKGAVNLPLLLKEEARQAFEDRKHLARKQGEKASTKLLGPMMLLLMVTLVIIMVPAFKAYF